MPTLGQGTWAMGEQRANRKTEVAALRYGIELGLTLIDTAEMYGNGGAEEVVAEAITGLREQLFLVSKILPGNASRHATIAACERSLQRLNTDYLDLYLLHWRGNFPLEETFSAFRTLQKAGKIRAFGVSNFDQHDMQEADDIAPGALCVNQVLYHLGSRGIEWDLLPWQQQRKIALMAYSPLCQGELLRQPVLQRLALELSVTPAQLALAWLLHQGVVPIPKSATIGRVEENRKAWDIILSTETRAVLDTVLPPPHEKIPLDVL